MEPAELAPLFSAAPAELEIDDAAPWTALGEPLDRALAELPSQRLDVRLPPDIHLIGDRIAIGKGTRILPGAIIEGPAFIGEDVLIRGGSYLRGGVWIGDGCVIGASTEIKRSILLPGAHAPHLNYVGDSILGSGVNLGAGTILSNFRFDGGEVHVPTGPTAGSAAASAEQRRIPTGRRKLGAILGDDAQTGCNCVLSPGVVVGRGTVIYAGVQLPPGVYEAERIVKLRQEIEIVERRP